MLRHAATASSCVLCLYGIASTYAGCHEGGSHHAPPHHSPVYTAPVYHAPVYHSPVHQVPYSRPIYHGPVFVEPTPVIRQQVVVERPIVIDKPDFEPAGIFQPRRPQVTVRPGDTLFTICLAEYGVGRFWRELGDFNGHDCTLPLHVGMLIVLPAFNPDGTLADPSAATAAIAGPDLPAAR